MANQSLAVKYRPNMWDAVIGQPTIVDILKTQAESGKFSRTILLCGPAGCGKTTLARIFAKAINNGKGTPIEIDGASNNGVDNVRDIIDRAQQKALDAEYKCFIIDECFAEGTMVKTKDGNKPIEDVKPGMLVYTADGVQRVIAVHKLQSTKSHMCKIHLSNGESVVCTQNHLVLTDCGWVPAKNLVRGDIIVYDKTMCDMQNNIHNDESSEADLLWELCKKIILSKSQTTPEEVVHKNVSDLWQRICNIRQNNAILLSNVWKGTELAASQEQPSIAELYSYLCDLWQYVDRYARESDKRNLFLSLLFPTAVATSKNTIRVRSWDGTQETSVRAVEKDCRVWHLDRTKTRGNIISNASEKSFFESRNSTENVENERIEWESAFVEGETWRKWTIYSRTIDVIQCIRRFMGIGVSGEDKPTKDELESLSYCIQIRPCLSFDKVGDRGGWQYAQLEKAAIARQQERNLFERVTVESVEIYKSTNTEESKTGSCDDIYVYDLTVAGSPTYYANNVLVHNCHSLSNNAWQAFLKTIEEPPAKSVFLFCTTDPQKIPNTILSRVQRFDIKRISFEDIVDRLKFIIKSENITTWEEPAVEYIAKIGDGGMRESISLLQKALSYSKNLTVDNTIKALGIIDYSVMFDLINAIYDGEESRVIDIIEKQYRDGADLKQFIKQFTLFLLDIRKYSLFNSTKYISIPDTYLPELKKYIKETDEKVNKMFLDQVNELNSSIKWETVVKPLIELKLLMLCK